MIAVFALACATCPDGFEAQGGQCTPTGGGLGVAGPLTEASFQDRYADDGCDTLEDCVCDDLDVDTCDLDLDCDEGDFSWPTDCTFDRAQAEACLAARWSCDTDGNDVFAIAPTECETVYDCGDP